MPYFPAAQSVHATLPLVVLYFPLAQALHVPGSPVYPALQVHTPMPVVDCAGHEMQLAEDVIPVPLLYFPVPQNVHAAEPDEDLYFPTAQAVQLPPLGPVYPGLHWH